MKNDRSQRKIIEIVKQPPDTGTKRGGGLLKKPFSELIDILMLFLVSRGILTIIGVISLTLIGRQAASKDHLPYLWLDVWGQWDTGWYLDIAKNWYSAELRGPEHYANYAFFPLYPTLMKLFGGLINSPYIAGLIISNAALLGGAFLLYKFVLLDHDRDIALNSVKYLFLWPTSFVLSSVLTEGLFLLLLVASFYSMRKNAWLNAGMIGFFLSLTRVIGICFSLPLLYEYMKARRFSLRAIRPDILALALVPAGLLLFSAYNYYLTGDFLAFVHIQSTGWGRQMANPLKTLLYGMAGIRANLSDIVSAWFTGFVLTTLVIFYRKIPLSHWLFCLVAIFIPLSGGLASMPRYLAVLFPLFILFAQLGKDRRTDLALTVFFAVLQGCLMVFWSIGNTLII
jgi:hypothetical protein